VSFKEGNIISFKILVNSDGHVVTEMSGIPEKDLHRVFKDDELSIIRNIVQLTKPKLEEMHEFLESELSALNHVVD
tara:strand:- start:1142 stop:1369 length:228 start_codon:yes stop_codon:yes gene_type:complete